MRGLPVFGVMAAGLALRLAWLTRKSLWSDEGLTLLISSQKHLVENLRHLDLTPPLYFLVMRAWLPLFGDPIVALRLFSALMGATALVLFYLWGRRASPPDAFGALCLAAGSSFWIHAAQDGRAYALYLVLTLASALLLQRLRSEGSPRTAAVYGAVCLAGLYTHYFFALVVGLHFLYQSADRDFRRLHLGAWLALHLAIIAAYLPWLPSLAAQFRLAPSASVLQEPLTWRLAAVHVGTFLFDPGYLGLYVPGWTALAGLGAAALAAIGIASSLRGAAPEAGVRYAAFCLGAGLAVVKAAELCIGHPVSQPRYLICLSPFLFLLAARGLRAIPGGASRAVAGSLAAGVLLSGTAAYYYSNAVIDPHSAAAADLIRAASRTRDPVVHLAPFDLLPMRYYYLSERAHLMVAPVSENLAWLSSRRDGTAVVDPARLAWFPRCVVVDPRRELLPRRIGLLTGKELAVRLGYSKNR
ncbi:MAG: glycosyltransferase family 39 protein [Elusimicrobiota bacterium]